MSEKNSKKLPKVRNMLNRHLFPKKYVNTVGESDTVPDHTVTIAQMLKRAKAGQMVAASQMTPVYHGSETFVPDPASMDYTDIHDAIKQNRARKQKAEAHERKTRKEAADKADKERIEAAVQAELAKRSAAAGEA